MLVLLGVPTVVGFEVCVVMSLRFKRMEIHGVNLKKIRWVMDFRVNNVCW